MVKDVDPATGLADEDDEGYDETYPLEDLELSAADFMAKVAVDSVEAVQNSSMTATH